MRKLLLYLILLSPFLTISPYNQQGVVTSFNLYFDGTSSPISTPAYPNSLGSAKCDASICYDLAPLNFARGSTHSVYITGCNSVGCSSASNTLNFKVGIPDTPVPTGQ